jgi:hypothetical protein
MKGLEEAGDNFGGRILPMLRASGFAGATEADPMNTIFGPVWFYSAVK